jgi:pyruvate/2-oxoglutarate dehydrogenase complex dihydrolipoamide acyltransferase (E2) component
MATEVLLPKLGFSMTEGVLSEWLVPDGGTIEAGAPLMAIESDKSSNEIESPATGKLSIMVAAGETCPVGTLLGVID